MSAFKTRPLKTPRSSPDVYVVVTEHNMTLLLRSASRTPLFITINPPILVA